jgi:hypothetical protein
MNHQLKARETVPVLAHDGRTPLGSCTVAKYGRAAGQPIKEIIVRDTQEQTVALIFVYRLHSRVCCGTLEAEAVFVDSKQAAAVARAALECEPAPWVRINAIQEQARRLRS